MDSSPTTARDVPSGSPRNERQVKSHELIKRYQSYPGPLIRRPDFQATLRQLVKEVDPDLRFQPSAVAILQEASEAYTVEILKESQVIAEHNGRITPLPKDIKLALSLRNMHDYS